jgi:hypothetical protein
MNTLPFLSWRFLSGLSAPNYHCLYGQTLARLVIPCLLGFGLVAAQARVIHVNGRLQTDPVPDGRTWATAWGTIADALKDAADGDEIWVAQGTYKEFVTLTNGVALYGGFAGTEIDRDQRNFAANTTTIYGDGGGINLTNDVVSILEVTNGLVCLDGFTVDKDPMILGSAIYTTNSSPVIANNRICGLTNFLNGVIQCQGGAPLIRSNYIAYNVTDSVLMDGVNHGSSGGIYCDSSDVHIHGNQILGNQSYSCAGIGVYNGSALVESNDIVANTSGGSSGGVFCWYSCAQIQNNRIVGNSVNASDGVYFGGGICTESCTNTLIANNLVMSNYKQYIIPSFGYSAAGIMCDKHSSGSVINNTVVYNKGGAVGLWCGSVEMAVLNNIIAFNSQGVGGATNMVFTNNCVYGNGTNNFYKLPDLTETNGNISLDPMLDGDSQCPGWHLRAGSPCIGTGDASLVSPDWRDLDGDSCIKDSHVDIGADAFQTDYLTPLPVIVHVAPTGNDTNNGLTWETAMRTVQAAMDRDVLARKELWVSKGIYTEHIAVRPFVDLYGGFAGVETNRTQRDWKQNATIMDGQSSGNVVQMVFLPGVRCLDGFTIQNGQANIGGGILTRECSPFIANSIIQNNNISTNINPYKGGGVYSEGCSLVLSNNLIQGNVAAAGGGVGIYRDKGDIVVGNTVKLNCAPQGDGLVLGVEGSGGGAIYVISTPATIINNVFASNVCTNKTVGRMNASAFGSAVYFLPWYVPNAYTSAICNNTFISNVTVGCIESGSVFLRACTNTLFANNLFAYNSSGIGGSIITNIQFLNNCLYQNIKSNYIGFSDQTGTNGNISVDPMFIPGTSQLSANSPCIDAGNDSVIAPGMLDLAGTPRFQGTHVDIGAYEYSTIPAGEWVDFVPGTESLQITPVTVGGITYIPWRFEFADSKYRMTNPETFESNGTNFTGRFHLEQWTGTETPGKNAFSGTFVLGALNPGDYAMMVNGSGSEVKTVSFSVPAGRTPTLSWQPRTEGSLKLQVAGVAEVTYRLLCATNLVNWEILSTHRGAPFELEVTNNPDLPTLFYRVEIVK